RAGSRRLECAPRRRPRATAHPQSAPTPRSPCALAEPPATPTATRSAERPSARARPPPPRDRPDPACSRPKSTGRSPAPCATSTSSLKVTSSLHPPIRLTAEGPFLAPSSRRAPVRWGKLVRYFHPKVLA